MSMSPGEQGRERSIPLHDRRGPGQRQGCGRGRRNGIRLIPLFNCLGHQSWAKTTFPLLARYPELDETPSVPKDNTGIYCRNWCPLHPKVNEIVFSLLDELIDAFQADAIHIGMDEVFLIASGQRHAGPRVPAAGGWAGYLFTVWSDAGRFLKALLKEGPAPEKPGESEATAATMRACIEAAGGTLPAALR